MSEKYANIECLPRFYSSENAPVGLDFGTSNSVIAGFHKTKMLKGPHLYNLPSVGYFSFPSMVFCDEGEIRVGIAAYNNRVLYPELVARSIKRFIGENEKTLLLGTNEFSISELATAIIEGLIREVITTELSFVPSYITITVPYYFKQLQNINILATVKQALNYIYGEKISEIKGVELLPEPIAASLCFLYEQKHLKHGNKLLTFDIGAGTLDLTLVEYEIKHTKVSFNVLSTEGIDRFGGDDVDEMMAFHILEKNDIDLSVFSEAEKKYTMSKLINEVQLAKHKLSCMQCVDLIVTNLPHIDYINCKLTKSEFKSILSGVNVEKRNFIKELTDKVAILLKKAKIDKSSIDLILPVGGSSKIVMFQEAVQSFLPNAELVVADDDTLFFSVSKGAAIYSALKMDELYGTKYMPFGSNIKTIEFQTKIAHQISVEAYNSDLIPMIESNTVAPISVRKFFYPTCYSDTEKAKVDLNTIRIFQGEGKSAKESSAACIGEIDLSTTTIYAHNRTLDQIPIEIVFEATSSLIDIDCIIKGSGKNQEDLCIKDVLKLKNK